MGWKLSSLLIDTDKIINDNAFLKALGFNNYTSIEEKTFEEVMNPNVGDIYIGTYKNKTIICVQEIPLQFLDESIEVIEENLITLSNNHEISAVALHSVVNFYGFSYVKNGIKYRAKSGASDEGLISEYGEPLDVELELLSKSYVNSDNERVFQLDEYPDDVFTEDQMGEEFVFQIFDHYFDEPLDTADDLLFETKFRGYSINPSREKTTPLTKDSELIKSEVIDSVERIKQQAKSSKWLKYLVYIFIIFSLRLIVKYFSEL